MKLTDNIQALLKEYIKKSFDRLRFNLIGPGQLNKKITFSFADYNPKTTLSYNYINAVTNHTSDANAVDKAVIKKIQDVAGNYIDHLEQKAAADVTRVVGEHLDNATVIAKRLNKNVEEVLRSDEGSDILKSLRTDLKDQKSKIDESIKKLVTHELHNAQGFGSFDGILNASRAMGIQDPTVYKILISDEKTCKYCKKLWLLDGKTPKVYKLSELSATPGSDYKNPAPCISVVHINCRCVLSLLSPGFGFNEAGRVVYVGKDYDEFKKQRG